MSQEKVLCRVFKLLGLGKPDMSSFENRLKYQKVVYLLQSFGLSLDYGFTWYLKGPYSSPLAHTLFSIEKNPMIYDESESMKFKNEEEIVDKLNVFKEKLGEGIGDVLYLEVLASLHYINKSRFSGKGNLNDLKGGLFDAKPHLLGIDNVSQVIEKAYKDLNYYN